MLRNFYLQQITCLSRPRILINVVVKRHAFTEFLIQMLIHNLMLHSQGIMSLSTSGVGGANTDCIQNYGFMSQLCSSPLITGGIVVAK